MRKCRRRNVDLKCTVTDCLECVFSGAEAGAARSGAGGGVGTRDASAGPGPGRLQRSSRGDEMGKQEQQQDRWNQDSPSTAFS